MTFLDQGLPDERQDIFNFYLHIIQQKLWLREVSKEILVVAESFAVSLTNFLLQTNNSLFPCAICLSLVQHDGHFLSFQNF